eukprot:4278775-Alexandrium_andersonii.AAC.1
MVASPTARRTSTEADLGSAATAKRVRRDTETMAALVDAFEMDGYDSAEAEERIRQGHEKEMWEGPK